MIEKGLQRCVCKPKYFFLSDFVVLLLSRLLHPDYEIVSYDNNKTFYGNKTAISAILPDIPYLLWYVFAEDWGYSTTFYRNDLGYLASNRYLQAS